jgi:hypothetical protein
MAKKATKTQEQQAASQFKGRLTNAPSTTLNSSARPVAREGGEQVVAEGMRKQVYSSEQQALEVLVDSIVGKLSDTPEERAEMQDFLEMILDTDPMLREEILASTAIRK